MTLRGLASQECSFVRGTKLEYPQICTPGGPNPNIALQGQSCPGGILGNDAFAAFLAVACSNYGSAATKLAALDMSQNQTKKRLVVALYWFLAKRLPKRVSFFDTSLTSKRKLMAGTVYACQAAVLQLAPPCKRCLKLMTCNSRSSNY